MLNLFTRLLIKDGFLLEHKYSFITILDYEYSFITIVLCHSTLVQLRTVSSYASFSGIPVSFPNVIEVVII